MYVHVYLYYAHRSSTKIISTPYLYVHIYVCWYVRTCIRIQDTSSHLAFSIISHFVGMQRACSQLHAHTHSYTISSQHLPRPFSYIFIALSTSFIVPIVAQCSKTCTAAASRGKSTHAHASTHAPPPNTVLPLVISKRGCEGKVHC